MADPLPDGAAPDCPAVPIPKRGTVGHPASVWDSARDGGGTPSLKALARMVLARDTGRDTTGTEARTAVPHTLQDFAADGTAAAAPPEDDSEAARPGPLPHIQDPDPMLPGLLQAALRRPPAWSDPSAFPSPDCRCTCCGGQRWWTEAEGPRGWRCRTCHPTDHLAAGAVRAVDTAQATREA